jgi:hypothetical protein
MRQLYSRSFTVTWATGDSGYVFSDRIDSGFVLHVKTCFAYAPEREANDDIVIGVRNGGQDIILQAQATLAVQLGSSVPGEFYVGEGDQIYAYFPDADNGDSIGLHINGAIYPRVDWEKGGE